MKRCNRCKEDKPLSDFHKNRAKPDGVQNQCKLCKKETDSQHYKDNRAEQHARNRVLRAAAYKFVAEIKEAAPCMDCGIKYPSYVMDFDHVRDVKFKEISIMCNRAFSTDKILEEIKKCDLVCSNCHRIRTWNRKSKLEIGEIDG